MSVNYVEYLQGNNESYINTGVAIGIGYQIDVTFMLIRKPSTTADDAIYGASSPIAYNYDNSVGTSVCYSTSQNSLRIRDGNEGGYNTRERIEINESNCLNNKYTLSRKIKEATNTYHVYLFANNHVDTILDAIADNSLRVYDFKIYNDSNTLLIHLRPCLDIEGVPCMYDEVSKQYFYNQGTGTFGYKEYHLYLFADNNQGTAENLGSYRLYNMKIDGDLEGIKADEINYVDYLEGDGASWIDTGIYANAQYKYELQFEDTTLEAYENLFGANVQGFSFQRRGTENKFEINYMSVNSGAVGTYPTTKATILVDKNKVYCDDVLIKEFNVTNNTTAFTRTTYLFDRNPIDVRSNAKVYYFKMWNENNELVLDFRPCLDTEGIPCMYDEVSKQYFYNQGSGTFGYKKKLRDFQPVLDSNGIPCLMDKINKKYYYDKNGKGFGCDGYSGVSYIKGDGASWIDTGIIANQMHGYRIETKIINKSVNTENTILFGSSQGGMDSADVNCHLRYNYYGYSQGLTFIEDSGTGQGWSMKVNEIYTFVMTINQPTSSNSFYLCAGNERDNAIGVCDCGIYYWKIYDTNNNLIQHLIPAIDTDGSIGMYDLVTETFHYNQGTGTFSYGIEELECPKADYVEYLEGGKNGQYIATDIYFNSSYKYVLKAQAELTSFWIMGTTGFESNMSYRSAIGINPDTQVVYFGKNQVQFGTGYGDIHYEENAIKEAMQNAYEITLSANGFIINGINYDYTTELNVVSANKMVLFSHVYGSSNQNVKFYYYKVYNENDELIQDFRPCLDNNNIPCMYDTISGEYFYNQGEGEFTYGKSIGYTPIKYIETNGTQYIDTGVVVNDNTYMDIDYRAIAKEYTPVEYLQGDGNSFIETGIQANPQYKYEITISINPNGGHSWNRVFGSSNESEMRMEVYNTHDFYYQNNCVGMIAHNDNRNITYTIENGIITNGTNTITFDKIIDTTPFSGVMRIFDSNSARKCQDDIHSFKMWDENNVLVFDGIPVLDSEGTPCMYDKVSKQFFYNKGTGTFSYGGICKNYLMNDFYTDTTYKYKEIDTTVEPNLTASAGATLTLGSTYIPYLTESEIEQAIKNGWIIQ